jgi:hypothetical protein
MAPPKNNLKAKQLAGVKSAADQATLRKSRKIVKAATRSVKLDRKARERHTAQRPQIRFLQYFRDLTLSSPKAAFTIDEARDWTEVYLARSIETMAQEDAAGKNLTMTVKMSLQERQRLLNAEYDQGIFAIPDILSRAGTAALRAWGPSNPIGDVPMTKIGRKYEAADSP